MLRLRDTQYRPLNLIWIMPAEETTMRKLNVRTLIIVAMFAAIAFVLNSIKIFTMPYGGSVSCCSMMPILLLAVLLGNRAGMLGGLVLGCLSIINGAYVIHPIQFLLDYLLPYLFLGVAGFWGYQNRGKVLLGALIAVVLSVSCNIVSGAVYFGSYAPEGMNPWVYSIVYNLMSNGVEGALSILVLMLLPLQRFAEVIRK